MRITFVLPPLNPSGGVRVVAIHGEGLRRRGHEVIVVTTSPRKPSLRWQITRVLRGKDPPPWRKPPVTLTHFEGTGIDVRRLSHPAPVTDADLPDGDVVIATWWETAPAVMRLSPSKGRKIYFLQGYEPSMPVVPTEEGDATWRLPMQKVVVAEWLRELARERFGDPTAICVPNSVDPGQFFAPPRGKQPVPTVGFIHAPVSTKGTDIAINAIIEAKKAVPSLRAVCFGHSPPGIELPVPDWFEFTRQPPQDKLRDLYASCDVFLQPSRVEGFGLPILEAMACRTPVIATPAGAGPELVAPGGGRLVAHDSVPAMAAAIVEVVGLLDAEWRRMSEVAFKTATGYSWDDATAAFERALLAVAPSR